MAIIPRANPGDIAPISPLMGVRNDARVQPVSGATEAVAGIARQGLRIHQEATDRNDTVAVMAARRQLSDWEASTFDPANPNGIQKFQGGNALGADEALLPDLDKRVSEISGKLNGRQQQAFLQVADNFRASVQERLTAHMTREHDGFLQAEEKATTDGLLNDAIGASIQGDYGTGTARLAEGASALRLAMTHRGQPEAAIAQAEQAYASSYHTGVVSSMLQSDPDKALAYYGDHADELVVDDRLKLEAALRPVATESTARSLVDSWVGGGPAPVGATPVEGAARTEAEAVEIARASIGRTVGLESGGQANAKNPASTATGAAQFLDGTWLDVITRYRPDLTRGKSKPEVLALRTDPTLSKAMAEAYAVENCKGLFQSGLPVTPETAYLCHHFGLAGARNLLRASPDTPVRNVLDPQSYAANKYLQGKTVAEVIGNHAARAGEATPPPLTATGQPDYPALEQRAAAIPNTLLRRAALADLEQRRAIADRAEADRKEAMAVAINKAVEEAPPGVPYAQVLTPDQQAWAREHGTVDTIQARLKQRATGTLVQSNPVLLDAYLRESATDPATFATRKAEILAHAHELATADLTTLVSRIDALNDPKKRAAAQAEYATEQQRLLSGMRTLGIDPKSKKPADVERAALWVAFYRQAEAAYVQKYGEIKGADADRLRDNAVRGFAETNGKGVRAFERMAAGLSMTDNQGREFSMSPADRAAITRTLRARLNRAPTDAEVIRAASAYYAGGGR